MRISFASNQPSDALALAAMCPGGRVDRERTCSAVDCAGIRLAKQVPH
jgi:hypothetical protein